jgi:three-Cys-motif partner protein
MSQQHPKQRFDMASKDNQDREIEIAHPHTIKKFELIEEYVKVWAQKLLNNGHCNGIVFIDSMSNSGIYQDDNGNEIKGSPIRVASYISEIMKNYSGKQARLYFNDLSKDKINILKTHLPTDTSNFHITTHSGDGNEFMKTIDVSSQNQYSYLLVYDPYQASVDWEALIPFLRNWSEVIINHMVSDSIRGVSQAKSEAAIAKYEQTYLSNIQELATFGSNREAYEKRIREIMSESRGATERKYYIASFPFFNTRNALVYNLIHGTSHIEGFKLFKKTAWKVFGGKSSAKKTHISENQLVFDLTGEDSFTTHTDEFCYNIQDIAKYLFSVFKGRAEVPLKTVWPALDEHSIFPSEGYANDIKTILKNDFGCTVFRSSITFPESR